MPSWWPRLDGAIAAFNGNTRTSSYTGKLADDTITGTITVPGRDGGEPRTLPWTATRKKG